MLYNDHFILDRVKPVKNYSGDRTIDGIVVTVDGVPLEPCLQVHEFTDQGFEWAYNGDEPRQLALALLVDHGLEPAQAIKLSQPFMQNVTSKLDNTWLLTTLDINDELAKLDEVR
jgi:hypothetical protein